jgi:hypothetical protein
MNWADKQLVNRQTDMTDMTDRQTDRQTDTRRWLRTRAQLLVVIMG